MHARPALTVLLAVLLSGCAAGTEEQTVPAAAGGSSVSSPPAPASSAPTPSTTPPSTTPSSPPATPAATTAHAVRTIDVAYAGGQVTGTDGREDVALGEQVVLRITSDVAEEVHVHGYDLVQDLPAGVPVELPMTATIPGGFEVELHDSGRALFQLRVA